MNAEHQQSLDLTLTKKSNLFSKLQHLKNALKNWEKISIYERGRDKFFLNTNVIKTLRDLNIIMQQQVVGYKLGSEYRWNFIEYPEVNMKLIVSIEELSRQYARENSKKSFTKRKIESYNEQQLQVANKIVSKPIATTVKVQNEIENDNIQETVKFSLKQLLFIKKLSFENAKLSTGNITFNSINEMNFFINPNDTEILNIELIVKIVNTQSNFSSGSIKIEKYKEKSITFYNINDSLNARFTIS